MMADGILDIMVQIERHENNRHMELLEVANRGDVRCWLNGMNPDDEKMTLTIYGKLTPQDRKEITDFACMIDQRRVAE